MPLGCPSQRSHYDRIGFLLWLVLMLGSTSALAATPVGEVIYAHGITSAQRPGEAARFIAKGDPIHEGDVISTGPRGFAIIGLKDETKMTLRPNTVFAVDKFSHNAKEELALFRLVKGGVRALTGLIGKRNPQGMRVRAVTATIGIRGTSFDARICEADCAQEVRSARKDTAPPPELIVARVVLISGAATVTGKDGQARTPVVGTPLFDGDAVRTQKDSYVVLAFRDQSKVTVIADSEFKLENVRFSGPKADSGNFVVRVVRGGARVLTGLLAKREPKTVQVNMITAVIGIRGTGFDNRLELDCVAGACSEAAFVHTWEGVIAMQVGDRSLVVETNRAGVFNPIQDRLVVLDKIPEFFLIEKAPRPDTVEVDFDKLFGTTAVSGSPSGVYVGVLDGHVEFSGPDGSVNLGPGEGAYLAEGGTVPVRLDSYPSFMLDDPAPRPEKFDEQTIRPLEALNPGGGPGSLICEL